MGLENRLKKINFLRTTVKKIKIYREFLGDARDFSNNYLEVAESRKDYRYRLMLLVHNIEKGLCRDNPRPFGFEKIEQIVEILINYHDKEQYEYKLACGVVVSWKQFFNDKKWSYNKLKPSTIHFINSLQQNVDVCGRESFSRPICKEYSFTFEQVIMSRRSVRDFENLPLKQEDIDFAIDCFIAAPTACNRQMCKIYQIESKDLSETLSHTILGVGGFNTNNVTYFLITFDQAAFEFYGERNQGYLNTGLTAMNFINGLHARGIGSCCLQWSNNRADDLRIRNMLNIPKSERIGVFIGAGYYKSSVYIPCSNRKSKDLVYKVI